MRVLIFGQYFPPDFGGASTRAYNIAKGLQTQDCDIVVVTAFPHFPNGKIPEKYKNKISQIEDFEKMKVIRTWVPKISHTGILRRLLLYASFFFSSIIGITKVGKVDVIFSANPSFFGFFPALTYSIFLHKKIIRNVDDLWPEVFYSLGYVKLNLLKKILDFFAWLTYKIPIAIIPVSNGYVSTIVTKYGIPKEKIHVIEHGVDIKKFQQNINSNDVEKTKKIITYSGALSQGYDFDIIFETAKLLKTEPIQFIIRGKGELEEQLKKQAKAENLPNVQINTDFLSKEELISFLNKMDIFLLPMSRARGFDYGLPTKILESQALGKPIICISVDEPGKYILRTKSGLVTESRDPVELRKLILRLTEDETFAKELGNNGLKNVQENLTIEMIGKKLMEILKKYVKN